MRNRDSDSDDGKSNHDKKIISATNECRQVRVAKDIASQMCDVLDGGEYVGVLNAPNMAAARKSKLTSYVSLGERMGALQAQLLGQGKVRCLGSA